VLIVTGASGADLGDVVGGVGAEYVHKLCCEEGLEALVQRLLLGSVEGLTLSRRFGRFAREHGLSRRQRDIVALELAGYTAAEMTERLRVSPNTLKTQIRRLLEKTNDTCLGDVSRRIRRGWFPGGAGDERLRSRRHAGGVARSGVAAASGIRPRLPRRRRG
jgi:DNA-binding CsgD family transcriptional regulator